MARRACKVDRNHAEIAKALRDAGCGVIDMSALGKGVPDLLVHAPTFPECRMPVFLEIKDGEKSASRRQLTPAQVKFHSEWKGWIFVVTSVDEAYRAIFRGEGA